LPRNLGRRRNITDRDGLRLQQVGDDGPLAEMRDSRSPVAADRHVRPTRRECLQLHAEIDDRINVSFCRHRSASVR
jgi:hypothetical protein